MKKLSNDNVEQLDRIFMPRGTKQIENFFCDSNKFLAYYTSADTALKIIKNKEIWMRNVTAMNDYGEIRYGLSCLKDIIGKHGEELEYILGQCTDASCGNYLMQSIRKFLCNESISWLYNTYICCFTEHDSNMNDKDVYGRLSMWRAYGRDNGVALVLSKEKLNKILESRKVTLTPVSYLTKQSVEKEFLKIIELIKDNKATIKSTDRETLHNVILNTLRLAIVSIKHPGFEEEQEWRLVVHGDDVHCDVESIDGVVQPVYKFKLENDSMRLKSLLCQIIIGPRDIFSEKNVSHKAFVQLCAEELKYSNEEAEKIVIDSSIPYRPV